jgi:Ala-tRNA(Pro) deacylase
MPGRPTRCDSAPPRISRLGTRRAERARDPFHGLRDARVMHTKVGKPPHLQGLPGVDLCGILETVPRSQSWLKYTDGKEVTVAITDVTSMLDGAGAQYELLEHEPTESGITEARALGVPAEAVAKTLILDTPSGHVRALIPASDRIDMRKAAELLEQNRHHVHLASEEELARDYPEFELGAVPPLAGSRREPVLVDARLVERDSVLFEAGSHRQSVRVATSDLLSLTQARTGDICCGQ